MSLPIEDYLDQEIQADANPPGAADPSIESYLDQEIAKDHYGSFGQQVLTGVEGLAKGAFGPVATAAERALSEGGIPGLTPEDQAARALENPFTSTASEVTGFVGPALASLGLSGAARTGAKAIEKYTQAGVLSKVGEAVAPKALGKIGSYAVRGAVENVLFQAGDEVSQLINGDPNVSVQTALPHLGLAAVIGGTLGGGVGAVSSYWKKKLGSKTGSILNSISDKMGGIEGVTPNPIQELVSKAELEVAPEIQAAMSNDPVLREMFSVLNQTDTTVAGREIQNSVKEFNTKAANVISESLGVNPEKISSEIDKYTLGKKIGNTLADEFKAQVDPLAKKYEELAKKYHGVKLTPEVVAGLEEKVGNLATEERWVISPSSDIMKEVNRIQKELPNLTTLSDLTAYIQRIGENMQSNPLNGPLKRAGGLVKSALRDTEAELIAFKLGETEGALSVEEYQKVRAAYAAQSELREALDSRLHAKGTTSSYASQIREMAQTDGEAVLRKLSGKDDADLLNLLQEKFPGTAQAVRNAHIEQVLSKAKSELELSPHKIVAGLKKLSPQLRSFITPPQNVARIEGIGEMLERLKDKNHNFSNTGRTVLKLLKDVPGSAVGMVAALAGHNPIVDYIIGSLSHYVVKEGPDSVRLGLLKWLGSNKPIDAGAFKSMVDFIHYTTQGNNLMTKAAKELVMGSSKVIPAHILVSESHIKNLDKKLKDAENNQDMVDSSGRYTSYYLPNEGIATSATAGNAIQYLNSIRPVTVKNAPLDPEIKPSKAKVAAFHRALIIAEQPLMIAQLIKDKQLTREDMTHVQILYPQFLNRFSQKVNDQIVDHLAKGKTIPYDMRAGLSLLLGQPLDSGLTMQSIMANQAVFAVTDQEGQQMERKPSSAKAGGVVKKSSRLSLERNDDGT